MRTVIVLGLALGWVGCTGTEYERTLTMRGSACGVTVDYGSPPGMPMQVVRDDAGMLRGIRVGDCAVDDTIDEASSEACMQGDELFVLLTFDHPERADAQTVQTLEEGLIGVRGFGTFTAVTHGGGELVAIDAIDCDARELSLRFSLPVYSHNAHFPPEVADDTRCQGDTITGTLAGYFELNELHE